MGQARGQRVALQVVDGQERQAACGRDRLTGHDAHEYAADQPRPGGRCDPVELGKIDFRLGQRTRDQAVDMVEMAARGDLRHHATVRPVLVELGEHQIGENAPLARHHRGRGLVAGGLDAEDVHDAGTLPPIRKPRHARVTGARPVDHSTVMGKSHGSILDCSAASSILDLNSEKSAQIDAGIQPVVVSTRTKQSIAARRRPML